MAKIESILGCFDGLPHQRAPSVLDEQAINSQTSLVLIIFQLFPFKQFYKTSASILGVKSKE